MALHLTKRHADSPDVVAHPPVLYAAGFLIGYALDYWLGLSFGIGNAVKLGWIVMLGGVGLAAWSFWAFRKAGTNVPTNLPATAIVTSGPYLVTRNPIYIALTLIYFGLASLLDAPLTLATLVVVLVVMHKGVVLREEAYLQAKFGEAYRAYCGRTKRYF